MFSCAILENRAPLRRTFKIFVRRISKVCAMAHIAHARIIPDTVTATAWTKYRELLYSVNQSGIGLQKATHDNQGPCVEGENKGERSYK